MKQHNWYYLFLFIIFAVGVIVIRLVGYSKSIQMEILVMLALFYVILGILHHALQHTITAKIVIEYIAIATLGISVVLFVLQGI